MSGFVFDPKNFNAEGAAVSLCLKLLNSNLKVITFTQLYGRSCNITLQNDINLKNNLIIELNKLFK